MRYILRRCNLARGGGVFVFRAEGVNMKFVIILGAQAVGKMTVGQELVKITQLRLLTNHTTWEFVHEHFGGDFGDASDRLKEVILEEFAKSDQYGLVFTGCMNYDNKEEWDWLYQITNLFKKVNADIYCVELTAPQEIRLQRNNSENRLLNKATKRDIEKSNQNLIYADEKARFVSNDGEIPFENFIKIDNINIAPDVAAKMIKEKFLL